MMIGNMSMSAMQRPDPSQMASKLFSKLDTKGQGYLEKSDLASAFSQIGSDSSVDDVFSALDGDSDGKVSESEFSSGLTKLQETLDSQFNQMRMAGAGGPQGQGGTPPPPPPENDAGFTQDELSAQLEEIGSTDSQRAELLNKIVDNFEAADSDGDGKVSFQEAMAYDQQSQTASSGDDGTSASSDARSTEAQVMMKIMQLIHAYRPDAGTLASNTLSAEA